MKKKKIAFMFSKSPYGVGLSREGLDISLAISSMVESKISLFFIGDGVFQLMKNQKTKKIFLESYTFSFKIFHEYQKNNFYICKNSLMDRGLVDYDIFFLKTRILKKSQLRKKIKNFDYFFCF